MNTNDNRSLGKRHVLRLYIYIIDGKVPFLTKFRASITERLLSEPEW